MKNRLLLIGYNFYPEPTGIGKYSGEMVSWFVSQGYDCTVVTSYPYYPFWKIQEPYYKRRFRYTIEKTVDANSGGSLEIYRCPQYVPNNPSGLKRMVLDLSFLTSAFFPVLKLLAGKKFDYVMTVAPSFQLGLFGILFRKLHKAKFLYHIQDLQIEAAKDLKLIKSKGVINLLFKVEKYIFNKCDVISTISPGMVVKVRNKAKKDVLLFPNWTDVNSFYPIEDKSNLKKKFSYEPSDKIVLYSGAIGEKQGLDSILTIANQLRSLKNIKFIICGSGPYKKELQDLAKRLKLSNVNFMPLQPPSEFNDFLNLADIHLVLQKASAVDLVMPSKLSAILAVGGLAIVTANPGSGLHTLIKEHKIGVLVSAENIDELKACILNIVNNDYSAMNINARKYAEEYLRGDKILNAYESFIQSKRVGQENILSDVSVAKVGALSSKIKEMKEPKSKLTIKINN
ncbi:WcaI family glycosyltransferase [Chryseolinea sp. H1M3-3]|uniref:WcaI family glycosyltransferase n=1 Tax=Chryseolinea sp. H1M3-3 TaxID=3034144 RepID=UPI0023EAFC9C|nr:WcaI family glycosyltransferase [Chryseolinea sp. H1M3-3]